MFNFGYDIVDKTAADFPEKIAVKSFINNELILEINYADLHHHSDITAYYLQKLGIKKGSRVMLCGLENMFEIEFIITALHKLCATIVFDLQQKPIERCNLLNVYAIISANNSPVIEQVTQNMNELQTVEVLISVGNPCPNYWLDLHTGTRCAKPFKPLEKIGEDQTSLIIFDEEPQFFNQNYPLDTTSNYVWDRFYRSIVLGEVFTLL
jgi:acetyl-CoA synthetase